VHGRWQDALPLTRGMQRNIRSPLQEAHAAISAITKAETNEPEGSDDERWEPGGDLGNSEEHVRVSDWKPPERSEPDDSGGDRTYIGMDGGWWRGTTPLDSPLARRQRIPDEIRALPYKWRTEDGNVYHAGQLEQAIQRAEGGENE